jgi:hypothetical protein
MGAFRVMGITRSSARAKARKHCLNSSVPRNTTFDEWFKKIADENYEKGKIEVLSAGFDTPQAAQQFLDVAKNDGLKYGSIEYAHPCGLDPKTKKLRHEWRQGTGSVPTLTAEELGQAVLL